MLKKKQNLSKKQWDLVQNVMSQISLDEVNEQIKQDEDDELKHMKQMVATTYREQYGKELSAEKLNQYFNVFQRVSEKLTPIEKKPSQYSWGEKIQLYFRGRFVRFEPTEENLLKYSPRNDDDIKSQAQYNLNLNRTPILIFNMALLLFNLIGSIYILNSEGHNFGLIFMVIMGWIGTFISFFFLKNLFKNLNIMKKGLQQFEQKNHHLLECRKMFSFISPLDERGVLGRFNGHLPDLTVLTTYSPYLNQRRKAILDKWIKEEKVVRAYDIALLESV